MDVSAEERLALLAANMETVRAQAFLLRRQWKRLNLVELDDLLQAGVVGLLEAMQRYEPGKNVPFGAYARHRIRGAMLDTLRLAVGGPVTFSLETEYNEPFLGTEERRIEQRIILQQLMAALTPRERDIIAEYLASGELAKYAQRLRLTQGRVSQIKKAAVEKMRRYLKAA